MQSSKALYIKHCKCIHIIKLFFKQEKYINSEPYKKFNFLEKYTFFQKQIFWKILMKYLGCIKYYAQGRINHKTSRGFSPGPQLPRGPHKWIIFFIFWIKISFYWFSCLVNGFFGNKSILRKALIHGQ